MNKYWLIAFIVFNACIFYLGYRHGANEVTVACGKQQDKQQQNTIDAQQHVIGEVQTQGQISQEASSDYAKTHNDIDNVYAADGVQQPAGSTIDSLPAVSTSACGTQTSKVYHLTPHQCDMEEAKCNGLWNWVQRQSQVH